MYSYNDITPKTYLMMDGDPYECLSAQVSRKQANKPVNKTKLKNLVTGGVIDYTFHVSDKIKPAEVERQTVKYLYANQGKGEIWFCEVDNPKNRFSLAYDFAPEVIKYIPENGTVDLLSFTNSDDELEPFGVKLPIKVELTVAEAPPAVKGNTATGGDKKVTLETGAVITTPLFIDVGDVIRVNTDTGEYIERASKA